MCEAMAPFCYKKCRGYTEPENSITSLRDGQQETKSLLTVF